MPAVRRPGWMRGGCRVPLPAPPKPEEERCSNPVCRCPAVRLARSSAGCALRFAAGRTKPSSGSSPSLRCTFPLLGSRWSIPQHNSHHAPGSGSQPLTWVFPSHLLENRLQALYQGDCTKAKLFVCVMLLALANKSVPDTHSCLSFHSHFHYLRFLSVYLAAIAPSK